MKTITSLIYPTLAALAFACFALSPNAQAVNPPPDGGYPNLNTAEGQNALLSLSTGSANTAVGWFSLETASTAGFNTGVGAGTLVLNTANQNTGVGAAALLLNSTGESNTAVGVTALLNNTTGSGHTAIGFQALYNNTSDDPVFRNTATGFQALYSNTTGSGNTANGALALSSNTTGVQNTAIGIGALRTNTTGNWNTATGEHALSINETGNENTACGQVALSNVTTGSKNVGIGNAGGCKLTTGSNNIAIVNPGVADEANTIRIGTLGTETNCGGFPVPAHTATYIAGISGTAVIGDTVVVNANGQLGTATSSARFKKEIKAMDNASEAVLALKPVRFQYKNDSKGTPQFGLIAEEVARVNQDLVIRDRNGEIYSVRYDAVNAMLLNEFSKSAR